MAILINMPRGSESLELIAEIDDAIDSEKSEYQAYVKDLDESHLVLNGEPTRFVLKRTLDFHAQESIQNSIIKLTPGSKDTNFQLGSAMLLTAKYALTGIKYPEDTPKDQRLEFKKGPDGYASEDLIAILNKLGVVANIFSACQNKGVVQNKQTEISKKK